jgi:major membrane immunogen (membrane-anchored lipoprotein)
VQPRAPYPVITSDLALRASAAPPKDPTTMQIRRTTVTLLATAALLAACDKGEETKDTKATEQKADEKKADEKKADAKTDLKADEKKAEDAKADTKAEDTKVEEPKVDPAPATPLEPGKPGPAYFAVSDKGVVMLDAGTFTKVEGGPDKLVKEIMQGPDGGMYLLGFEGVMKLEGAKAKLVAETGFGGDTGTLEDIAVTKDGKIWGVGYKGVSMWDGKAWKTEEKSVLGADVTLIRGVAVDGQDRVWVASSNAIHLRDADKWTTVDISKQFKRQAFFDDLSVGPGGVAMAQASDVLLKLTAPDALETMKVGKGYPMLSELGFSSTGVAGLKTGLDVVTRVMPDGKQTHYDAKKDFAASQIDDVTPDDSGRLWIATDTGVAIVGPGDERFEWKSGSIDELAGKVEVIGVAGAGPTLPAAVGPVKTGGLKGKIIQGGKGLASAAVEICPNPSSWIETTPCAKAPTKFSANTDAEGNFEMKDVPIGAYGLAVKVGDKWQLTYGSEFGVGMKEGEVFDIGSITLKDEETKK